MRTIVSSRDRASRGELAWIVDSEPSWPVFIACNMSSASEPRTSPTMMRSGRLDRALHELDGLGTERAQTDQVRGVEPALRELADRDQRTRQRERRDDRVDAAAVGQAGVHHRGGLVY